MKKKNKQFENMTREKVTILNLKLFVLVIKESMQRPLMNNLWLL